MYKGFSFEILWKDEDVFQVQITGYNGEFGAVADAYVEIGGLAAAAVKLEGFPKSTSDERQLELGTFGPGYAGGAVRMRFYCKDLAGHAVVETWFESDYSQPNGVQTAHFYTPTESQAIDEFVIELRRLESAAVGTARLRAAGPA